MLISYLATLEDEEEIILNDPETLHSISQYIENQFPEIYQTEGATLISFIKAYFEFLEQDRGSFYFSRRLLQNSDVDTTLDEFLNHFTRKYLNQFPYVKTVDNRFAIKHIMDYYRTKGTPQATALLLKFLFNEEASVYYPGKDVLKPSDSKYTIPKYIELSISPLTPDFLDQQIRGSISGATAFVEGVVRKRVSGAFIDVVYLSNIKGNFVRNEVVSPDGNYFNCPTVIGSLSNLTVINGGQGNQVGDLFDVFHSSGRQGIVRVANTTDATGRVNFNLIDGGSGYTLNTPYDGNDQNDFTKVYVATAMIKVDNSNTTNAPIQYEIFKQEKETLGLLSATDVNAEYFANTLAVPGDFLQGVKTYVESYTNATGVAVDGVTTIFPRGTDSDSNTVFVVVSNSSVTEEIVDVSEYTANASDIIFTTPPEADGSVKVVEWEDVANGLIISIANTDSSGNAIIDPSANTEALVQVVSGTFANQLSIDFSTNTTPYVNNEIVYEQQTITLGINAVSGSFSPSDEVEMRILSEESEIGNTQIIVSRAFGTVSSVSNTELVLEPAWGTFVEDETIGIYAANGTLTDSATITDVTVDSAGAIGQMSFKSDANTWIMKVLSGQFNTGNSVYGQDTGTIEVITNITPVGVTEVWYNGNNQANGVLDTISNSTTTGILVGQNTTYLGLYGNVGSFHYLSNAGITIDTDRTNRYAHDIVNQPDISFDVLDIATGSAANFDIGSLENEETVTLGTDLLGANNVANVPFATIGLDASNSGIGFVDSISIIDGGTQYTNGSFVTFNGGGYANGSPTIDALGEISTDGSGVITAITMINPGEGYFGVPEFTLPVTAGSVANISVNVDYGYGFIKNPTGDANTEFQYLFTFEDFTIGTIASLTRVNPGDNYNIDPFINVYNNYIAAYNRLNIILDITVLTGSFKVGENVTQDDVVKGVVVNKTDTSLTLKRVSFNTSFSGSNLIGAESLASATIDQSLIDGDSDPMGNNANVAGTVVVANGVATALEVIDSGYGYLDGVEATLVSQNANQIFTISANTDVSRHGKGLGYWTSHSSHLNDKKLHDNRYYQEYSYEIQTGVSLNKYRDVVKKVLHVAGTELFGKVIKISKNDVDLTVQDSGVTLS